MTLQQFAILVGAEPKWVLNTLAALPSGVGKRYTSRMADRLAVMRAIVRASGISIPRAYRLAGDALRAYRHGDHVATLSPAPGELAAVRVEVGRILAAVSARLSFLITTFEPARRGRKPAPPRDAIAAAAAYGLDFSLLRENLVRTPAERLRRLDGMAKFRSRVRRVAAASTPD
jgi:hypothetical protein